jgi:hypothetical protein
MKAPIIYSISIIIISVISCKDSTTNPTPSPISSTLMESSFENQGQPSLLGWQDGYPVYGYRKTIYSFDNDVPTNGGQWSLRSSPPDSTYSTLRFTVRPVQPSQSKHFILSFWCKDKFHFGFYDVSLVAYSSNGGYSFPVQPNDSTNWVQDTVQYYSGNLTIDSLVIVVSMFAPYSKSDTNKYVLLDKFKLEQF